MSYFKKSPGTGASPVTARLGALTWVLIYAGLLALVWGVWVARTDEDTGWLMMAAGALAVVTGAVLIYVRSRMGR